MNKYMGMTHEQLLEVQNDLKSAKDCRQFHRALCKVQKDLPFWYRGMPLHSRYPYFSHFISVVALLLTLLSVIISSFK